jgi:hypothetical protein
MAVGVHCTDHGTPLYPQKLALTSPKSGGCSAGIVHSQTKATELFIINVKNVGDYVTVFSYKEK